MMGCCGEQSVYTLCNTIRGLFLLTQEENLLLNVIHGLYIAFDLCMSLLSNDICRKVVLPHDD